MEKSDVIKLAEGLLDKHGLTTDGWRLAFNRRRTTWGQCWYDAKIIYLSIYFVEFNDEPTVRKTLLHEIAHALCPGHFHDRVWKQTCLRIGGDARIKTKRGDVKEGWAPYQAKCKCGVPHNRYRRPSKVLICRHCGDYLEYKRMRKGVFISTPPIAASEGECK